jgi:hypothetical protein
MSNKPRRNHSPAFKAGRRLKLGAAKSRLCPG